MKKPDTIGIDYERLQELTGANTPAEVAKVLIQNNIPPLYGKRKRPFLLPAEYLSQEDATYIGNQQDQIDV